jgi:WD40 repeat protein
MTEETIFTNAREKKTPAERNAYLDEACAGDAFLRRRVEALLKSDEEADRFLAEPAINVMPGTERRDEATAMTREAATISPADLEMSTGVSLGAKVRYFGDYELVQEIGRGGMGLIFRARQVSLHRIVALKMILTGQLASAADVQRFRTEAEAAANLDHPHIVPIYEIGEHEGQHYFSMKLIDGGNLTSFSREPTMSAQRRAGQLIAMIARAVHHAHQRGILHRDLKPGNILLDVKGEPHITDFGLAKRVESAGRLTQSGAIVGTPSYMAPEQARSERVLTTAVDVYSLGAVLYELLTGQPPFRADTPLDTILQVIDREPERPRLHHPKVDRDLETICLKCLHKQPAGRYGSAEALAEDLERWLRGESITARPVGRSERLYRWMRRNPVVAGLALSLIAVLLSAVAGLTALYLDADRHRRLAEHAEQQAKESADNSRQRLVHLYVDKGAQRLEKGDLIGALPWFAQCWELDTSDPRWESRDRRRIASVLQPVPRLTRFWEGATQAEFTSDGQRVLIVCSDGVRLWNVATEQLLYGPLGLEGGTTSVAFSPDGRRFASWGSKEARIWEVASGHPVTPVIWFEKPFLPSDLGNRTVSFSSDNRRLLLVTNRMVNRDVNEYVCSAWDTETGKPIAAPSKRIVIDTGEVVFSPNGRQLALFNESKGNDQDVGSEALVYDVDTNRPITPPLPYTRYALSIRFSPDSRRLVVAADHFFRLWDAATGQRVGKATDQGGWVSTALFSADGRYLLTGVATGSSGGGALRVWDAATGKPVSEPLAHSYLGLFSPDGRRIVSINRMGKGTWQSWGPQRGHESGWEACTTPIDCGDGYVGAVFSPDGQELAIIGQSSVQVWHTETGKPLTPPLTRGGAVDARFSRDGRLLLTAGQDARLWDLAALRYAPEPFEGLPDDTPRNVLLARDGQHVLVVGSTQTLQVWDAERHQPSTPPHRIAGSWDLFLPSADGQRVLTVGSPAVMKLAPENETRQVQLWDAVTGQPLGKLLLVPNMSEVYLTPDGNRFLAQSEYLEPGIRKPRRYRFDLRLWNARTGETIAEALDLADAYVPIEFSAEARRVLMIQRPRRVYQGETPAEVQASQSLLDHRHGVQVWDLATLRSVSPLIEHAAAVQAASLNPACDRVIASVADGPAKVWDVASAQPVTPPLTHVVEQQGKVSTASIQMVEFSSDGRQVVTVTGVGGQVRVWEATTGLPLTPPLASAGFVRVVRFSRDGQFLAVGGSNGVQVWDVLTGQPLGPTLGPDVAVEDLEFTPDCTRLLVSGNKAGWWDLEPNPQPLEQVQLWSQFLAGVAVDETGAAKSLDLTAVRSAWRNLRAASNIDLCASATEVQAWEARLVELALQAGCWRDAISHLDRQLASAPQSGPLYQMRADVLIGLGRFEDAIADRTKALELLGTTSQRLHDRGVAYA